MLGMGVHFVIGDPIGHSLSPIIYNTLYQYYKMQVTCLTARVAEKELASFMKLHRNFDVTAYNVTVPHKAAVIPFLDEVEEHARASSSVNCVVVDEQRRLHGYSTDGLGFCLSLAEYKVQMRGQNVVIIGAGGAASAIAETALREEAASLVILARRREQARELAQAISLESDHPCWGDSWEHIANYMPNTDVLIQCTSLGMQGYGHDFEDLSFLELLPRSAAVCDIVYQPAKTHFLQAAAEHGNLIVGGIGMLIWQAFACFELCYGSLPGATEMERVKTALRQEGYQV